ncbi:MAG: TauD/TfdA dioxygenase family protein [Segniliparus sp.]|uniref:TauD/TfdA dioxygenase family protein n=1 Tax=Segniliparus sp. TaxID=2804064 RepID=UPI003F3A730D
MSAPTVPARFRNMPPGPLLGDRVLADAQRQPYTLFELAPVSPIIGAEISGVRLSGELSPEVLAELRRALLEWKVLFFRDQDIRREEHRDFAALWGGLEQHPFANIIGDSGDVDVVALAKDATKAGVENLWHNDVTWRVAPSFAAILRAVEVPALGGDTLWADTGAAYDVLSDEMKEKIDGLVAEHDWASSFGLSMSQEQIAALRPQFPVANHPVVRVIPETGRRVLFVNRVFTERILGMDESESAELLETLYRHMNRPEFQVRLRWAKNTIAMWDNRACQHYAVSDYFPNRRVMERISVIGDRPVGVQG